MFTTEVQVSVTTSSFLLYNHLLLIAGSAAPASAAAIALRLSSDPSSSDVTTNPFDVTVRNGLGQALMQCEAPTLAVSLREVLGAPSPPPPMPPAPPLQPPMATFGDGLDIEALLNASAPALTVAGRLLRHPATKAAISTAAAVTVGLTVGVSVGSAVAASAAASAGGAAAGGAAGTGGGGGVAGLVPALFGAQRLAMYGGLLSPPPDDVAAAASPPSDWTMGRLGFGRSFFHQSAAGAAVAGSASPTTNATTAAATAVPATGRLRLLQEMQGDTHEMYAGGLHEKEDEDGVGPVQFGLMVTLADAVCSAAVGLVVVISLHLMLLLGWSRLVNRGYYREVRRITPVETPVRLPSGGGGDAPPRGDTDEPGSPPSPLRVAQGMAKRLVAPSRGVRVAPVPAPRGMRAPNLPPLKEEAYSASAVSERMNAKARQRQARAKEEQEKINELIAKKRMEHSQKLNETKFAEEQAQRTRLLEEEKEINRRIASRDAIQNENTMPTPDEGGGEGGGEVEEAVAAVKEEEEEEEMSGAADGREEPPTPPPSPPEAERDGPEGGEAIDADGAKEEGAKEDGVKGGSISEQAGEASTTEGGEVAEGASVAMEAEGSLATNATEPTIAAASDAPTPAAAAKAAATDTAAAVDAPTAADRDDEVTLIDLGAEIALPPPPLPLNPKALVHPPDLQAKSSARKIAWGSQWEATRGGGAKMEDDHGGGPQVAQNTPRGSHLAFTNAKPPFRPLPAVLVWPVPESIAVMLFMPGVVTAASAVLAAWVADLSISISAKLLSVAALYGCLIFLVYEERRLAAFSRAHRAVCWVPSKEPTKLSQVDDPLLWLCARHHLLRPYSRELGEFQPPSDQLEPARTERLISHALTPPWRWRSSWWCPSGSVYRCTSDSLDSLGHWLGSSSGATAVGMRFLLVLTVLQAALAALSGFLSAHPAVRMDGGAFLAPTALIALQLFGMLWASFLIGGARDRVMGAALTLCFLLEIIAMSLLLLSSLLATEAAAAGREQGDYKGLSDALRLAAVSVPVLQAAVYVPLARSLYDAAVLTTGYWVARKQGEDKEERPKDEEEGSAEAEAERKAAAEGAAAEVAAAEAAAELEAAKREAAEREESERAAAEMAAQRAAARREAEAAVQTAMAIRDAKATAAAKATADVAKIEEDVKEMAIKLVDLELSSSSAMARHKKLQAEAEVARMEAQSAAADVALRELRLRELQEEAKRRGGEIMGHEAAPQRLTAGPSMLQ